MAFFVLMLETVRDKFPQVELWVNMVCNAISDIVQMPPKKVRPIYSCSKDVCSPAFSSVTSDSLFMTTFKAGWPLPSRTGGRDRHLGPAAPGVWEVDGGGVGCTRCCPAALPSAGLCAAASASLPAGTPCLSDPKAAPRWKDSGQGQAPLIPWVPGRPKECGREALGEVRSRPSRPRSAQ